MTEAVNQLFDQVLVLRCQAGDERAFRELVERYHHGLRCYVCQVVDDADDADDVLQNIWFAVFRNLRTLRSPRAFPVWLFRVARNEALRTIRVRPRPVELREEPPIPAGFVAAGDDRHEDFLALRVGLRLLRPAHREVLMLRFVEGMNYEQIGTVMGCSIGTVRSRLHYAKEALRRAIRDQNRDKQSRPS